MLTLNKTDTEQNANDGDLAKTDEKKSAEELKNIRRLLDKIPRDL